jgi:fatty acid desaturase
MQYAASREKEREEPMLLTIAIILFILWALGLFAFNVGGGLIHLLVILAVIVLIFHFLRGRRSIV